MLNHDLFTEFDFLESVEKVEYQEDARKLSLRFKVSRRISKEEHESLHRRLSSLLQETTLVIGYDWGQQELSEEEFLNALLTHFQEQYPMLQSEDCQLRRIPQEDRVILQTPNEMLKKYIESRDIPKEMQNLLYREIGRQIAVEVRSGGSLDRDDFLEKTAEAEKLATVKMAKAQGVTQKPTRKKAAPEQALIGKRITETPIPISSLNEETYMPTVSGMVFGLDYRPIKDGKTIVTFFLSDETGATSCKAFWSKELLDRFQEQISEGTNVILKGKYGYDNFSKGECIVIQSLSKQSTALKSDLEEVKRVELRIHTQMSTLDGFTDITSLYQRAAEYGHDALAITDAHVVQAYPEAMYKSSSTKIKTIYGLDAKILFDGLPILMGAENRELPREYVVFDIETTGLSTYCDKITEIGAVRVVDGEITGRYGRLVNPEMQIDAKIVDLTGITNEMVADQPTIDEILPDFLEFSKGAVFVAHNAEFDISFIQENAYQLGLDFDAPYIDTLYLARGLFPELRNHKLDTLAKHFEIKLLQHHRAEDDAEATAQVMIRLLEELENRGIEVSADLNQIQTDWNPGATRDSNALILVAKQSGLKNLYQMISCSHMDYYNRSPGIPREILRKKREGLLIGSGNLYGELAQAILAHRREEELHTIARNYDFLEVQPPENYDYLLASRENRNALPGRAKLEEWIRKTIAIGRELDIPVVATGDVYYLNPQDAIYREIVRTVQFRQDRRLSSNLYYKTTQEMLQQFQFLPKEVAYEIVVTNSRGIADSIEAVEPIPKGTYPPIIDNAEEDLRSVTYGNAQAIYGAPLPELVEKRLNRELDSIIKNGYAGLYMISRKLVKKSNEDGYLVGSRGSVGSSFVATMAEITEVNPLAPHYVCPKCKHSEFVTDGSYESGIDMPKKDCPSCGTLLNQDGHQIPFEVFLGFDGDKEPDIDLNFAGEYQPYCHKYAEELFGSDKVFRAGTIGTIKENTAFGYIKKFYEQTGEYLTQAQTEKLKRGIVGVKRTTGQHPGGLMIVPQDKDIEDFTPVNYPADDPKNQVITTHFTYKAIAENILKLDLLGHDVPSIARLLTDLTGVDLMDVPMNDPGCMSIFNSVDALGFSDSTYRQDIGTLGVPEFGTNFVRQMLQDTKPTSFGELVRISGLSHGTNVWLNNAQELVRDKVATLKEVICTRDDIMTFLILKGLDNKEAFKIMETVRKGRDLSDKVIEYMDGFDLPSWYIDSCQKIEYMFPKAHAVAYSLMSYRIAYYKVYYPEAFYATYFTTKLADFPGSIAMAGPMAVKDEMQRIKELGRGASAKENSVLNVLEVVEEMYARGILIAPVRFENSQAAHFSLGKQGMIVPPFCALDDVSEQNSRQIYEELQKGSFISVEDFTARTKVNRSALESLRQNGVLAHLHETNQLDLFSAFGLEPGGIVH
ncbi:MAG: PolC-type DNA polymerase III [Tissierellia bacterium]|nr:PolC-type DNA polymerase III [Tissierellia bacterium]